MLSNIVCEESKVNSLRQVELTAIESRKKWIFPTLNPEYVPKDRAVWGKLVFVFTQYFHDFCQGEKVPHSFVVCRKNILSKKMSGFRPHCNLN